MGQKVNPKGLRVGVIKDWDSRWYVKNKDFGELLLEDNKIRKYVKEFLFQTGIFDIQIERAADKVKVTVYTVKPDMVIGRGGAGVEELRAGLEKRTERSVVVNVEEAKTPDTDAQLVAENTAFFLECRASFRRAMKQAIQRAVRLGAKGIKTSVSGRLGGADVARTEGYSGGTIPLQTLRADIDCGFAGADTTYSKIGVKVWLYEGEVLPESKGNRPNNRRDNKRGFGRDKRDNKDRRNRRRPSNNRRPQDRNHA